ncbi:MAG: ATP-binding cassette domain-containing protein [Chloroflexi bacterium]|nr:ATP-binding cassette domain-containing protein [Chloroflexota bacterium]
MQIELRNIHKHFGPVRANDGISLRVQSGTIHGLLGENGAGKSTLMKILSGYLSLDSGQILVKGRPVSIQSPAQGIRHGIGMLHQDPLDFPAMRVLDNFLLGRGSRLRQHRARAKTELLQLADRFGFPMDPEEMLSTLSIGERQQLEILRLISLGAETLILDEPTTGISTPQKVQLFATLHRLAAEGRSVIFVSHKLEDAEELCHRVTVLRHGRVSGEIEAPFQSAQLVRLMFGQDLPPSERATIPTGQPVLQLDHVTLPGPRFSIPNISMTIRAGEVIGLAGIEGSGQRLFLHACVGLVRPSSGQILLDGQDMVGQSYHHLLKSGMAFLPANRLEEGLVEGLTLAEHCILTDRENMPFFVRWSEAREKARQKISEYNIQGTPDSPIESLSGGNQQRALLSLLPSHLRLLALEHPTRGLDVESARWVWDMLQQRRRQGTAIVFTSADLDEIRERSERIYVFSGGNLSGPVDATETSTTELGMMIGGKAYEIA